MMSWKILQEIKMHQPRIKIKQVHQVGVFFLVGLRRSICLKVGKLQCYFGTKFLNKFDLDLLIQE